MMDELRDYRFYAQDMIHPNLLAIEYIWQKFKTVWVDKKIEPTLKKIDQVQKSLAHKAFDKHSTAYQAFKSNLELEIKALEQSYPTIKF